MKGKFFTANFIGTFKNYLKFITSPAFKAGFPKEGHMALGDHFRYLWEHKQE